MVKIKHLIRGRSQNKVFNTCGKSTSLSPLHAAEAESRGAGECSLQSLLVHVGFTTLWQPLEMVKWELFAQ